MCRSLLHMTFLILSSLIEVNNNRGWAAQAQQQQQQQGSFQTQDSFGETINVFNLTTISPNMDTESATKVSAETIETILGALDNAANTLENSQVSTLDAQLWTTEKLPSMDEMEDFMEEGGFTVTPDFPGSSGGINDSENLNNNNNPENSNADDNKNDPDLFNPGGDASEDISDDYEYVPGATELPDFITRPPLPGGSGSGSVGPGGPGSGGVGPGVPGSGLGPGNGGSGFDEDKPLNPEDAIGGFLPGRPPGGGPGGGPPGIGPPGGPGGSSDPSSGGSGGIGGPGSGSSSSTSSSSTTPLPGGIEEGGGGEEEEDEPTDATIIDEDSSNETNEDPIEIVAIDDGSGLNATVIETRAFDMTTYLSDLETRIVFHRLDNGICQLQCTVITRTDRLFKDENGLQLGKKKPRHHYLSICMNEHSELKK